MSKPFLTNIDMNQNELQNAVAHLLGTAPSTPVDGQFYYNTGDNNIYVRRNGAWKILGEIDSLTTDAASTSIYQF